jgi:hypothetical protein
MKKEIEKKIIQKEVFCKHYGATALIQICDIPSDMLPTDKIGIQYVDSYYSENNSWDAHTILTIYRDVLETDEEFEKRKKKLSKVNEDMKKLRYENYLKLKQEFEKDE